MASIPSERALRRLQSQAEREYGELVQPFLNWLTAEISRLADDDDTIPLPALESLQNEAQARYMRLYVGNGQPTSLDGVQPLSPFARLLYSGVVGATVAAVDSHARWLNRNTTDTVQTYLRNAPLGGDIRPPFRTPINFDPFHTWADVRGFTLSDRIWEAGFASRRKLGVYLDDNIRNGTSSRRMARELEQFLMPGKSLPTTNKPYGTTASFNAMRLARTEISLAHTRATMSAAHANPYTVGMDWKLSPSHPRPDICDRLATVGMGGQRLKEPYPTDNAPHVVLASHPQCICTNIPFAAEGDERRGITDILTRQAENNQPLPYRPPVDARTFAVGLLGAAFANQVMSAVSD